MNSFIGESVNVFVVVTALAVLLSFMAAKACAIGWKPLWLAVLYTSLVVVADRFLLCSLRHADFFDPRAFMVTVTLLEGLTYGVYRYFRTQTLVKQYPWLYEQTSLLTCHHKVTR